MIRDFFYLQATVAAFTTTENFSLRTIQKHIIQLVQLKGKLILECRDKNREKCETEEEARAEIQFP